MSLKSRATKCSGYIPPSQYVPVYSRPLRTSNVRWHEELSPITPKPSFDDPDNSRSRSIQQAVKAWLDSSPKSVIGVRGRSPTDSPRTSMSSPNRAVATPPDGEPDEAFVDATPSSPTFQKNKLTPWRDIVWKGGGSQAKDDTQAEVDTQPKVDDPSPTPNKKPAGDQSTTEEVTAIQLTKPTVQQEEVTYVIDPDADNYSQAIMEALRSSPKVPENYLKPPRVLEKAIVPYGGQNKEPFWLHENPGLDRSGGNNVDEIRGKEFEDCRAPGYGRRRFEDRGGNAFNNTAETNKCEEDFDSDSESLEEEANDKSSFISSVVSSPLSLYEERRFGGEGMNLIQIAGSGDFAAKSASQGGNWKMKPGYDSSSATRDEFDPSAENIRPTRSYESRRMSQPLYATDCASVSGHSQMTTRQRERYDLHSRPVSELSAEYVNGGKRDHGPTKTAAVGPAPEDSQYTSDKIQEENLSTPLEGNLSNRMRFVKQPFNIQETMERVRKEKLLTKVKAWEEAKNSEFFSRYRREETKIMAWEDHKKTRAEINLKKVELKLQEKRAKAIEKMENELAKARKKAEDKKAIAQAKRVEKAARAAEEAEIIRIHGRRPLSLFCFTP